MELLSNSDSNVTQLWNLKPEDGDDTFSEASVQSTGTYYSVPEGI
jgi:hypothetical protein